MQIGALKENQLTRVNTATMRSAARAKGTRADTKEEETRRAVGEAGCQMRFALVEN